MPTLTWDLLQWAGCFAGVAGAWLLGRRRATVRAKIWGWALFLVSNACWIAWGSLYQVYGLLIMQALFTITSIRGLRNNIKDAQHQQEAP